MISNLQGTIIYQGDYNSVEDLGYGVIKLMANDEVKLIHKTGLELLDGFAYDDAEIIKGSFVKIKKDDLWGLASLFGEIILAPEFDEIEFINGLMVLTKNQRFAIYSENETNEDIAFIFDEIEPVGENLVLVFNDDNEGLINYHGDFIIPLGPHEVIELGDYFSVKKGNKFVIYDKAGERLLDDINRLSSNHNFISYQKGNKWYLSPLTNLSDIISYDSIKLVSNRISAFLGSDSSFIRFNNGKSLNLKNTSSFKLLEPTQYELQNEKTEFILTYDKDGVKRMYNSEGIKILGGWFGEASVISHDLFLIEQDGKKGISDLSGKNVLPIEYDGIGNYFDGNVNLIKEGKFGLFNYPQRKIIDTKYDGRFLPLNNHMVIANKNKALGVIDLDGNLILDFKFEEIIKWTDSTVLSKKDTNWSLRNLFSGDSASIEEVDFFLESGDEKIIEYKSANGSGVLSNSRGHILEPQFDKIVKLNIENTLYFFTTKNFNPAEITILALFDYDGNVIWSNGVSKNDAKDLICSD